MPHPTDTPTYYTLQPSPLVLCLMYVVDVTGWCVRWVCRLARLDLKNRKIRSADKPDKVCRLARLGPQSSQIRSADYLD